METLSALSKILGSLFYFPVSHPNNQHIFSALDSKGALSDLPELKCLIEEFASADEEALSNDFMVLFEGSGKMPAAPWGSVYLDSEQVIFGDSTTEYREFLSANSLFLDTGQNEPEDHIGLMLMALAQICESGADIDVAKELLNEHFLPWVPAYLYLLENSAQTKAYRSLARLTQRWCETLQDELHLAPAFRVLYLQEHVEPAKAVV